MGTKSEALARNQRAVKPDTDGATGARRALSSGRPFSAAVTAEIRQVRELLNTPDGDIELLTDAAAAVIGVEHKFRKAVYAAGDKRRTHPGMLREYLKQWHSLVALSGQLLVKRREMLREMAAHDEGSVDAIVAKYAERVENAQNS